MSSPNTGNPADNAPYVAVATVDVDNGEAVSPNPSKPDEAPPAYDADMLPPGWEKKIDKWNRVYYMDHKTRTTHWELPSATPPSYDNASTDAAPASNPLLFSAPPPVPSRPSVARPNNVAAKPEAAPKQGFGPLPSPMEPVTGSTHALAPNDDREIKPHSRLEGFPQREWSHKQATFWFGPFAAIADTVSKNTKMCFTVVLVWLAIFLIVYGLVAYTKPSSQMIVLGGILGFLMYVSYLVDIAGPALGCCGKHENSIVFDVPRRALKSDTFDHYVAVKKHLIELQKAVPVLTLRVECFHRVLTCFGQDLTKKVITFEDSRQIPIKDWKDLSPSPLSVTESLQDRGAAFAAVRYNMTFDLCPGQADLLRNLMRDYFRQHYNRDTHVRVWCEYGTPVHQEFKVDNVSKPSVRYILSRYLWVNPLVFYFCLLATIYPIYLIVWKMCQKPYYLTNHKVLDIDLDNLDKTDPVQPAKSIAPMDVVIDVK